MPAIRQVAADRTEYILRELDDVVRELKIGRQARLSKPRFGKRSITIN